MELIAVDSWSMQKMFDLTDIYNEIQTFLMCAEIRRCRFNLIRIILHVICHMAGVNTNKYDSVLNDIKQIPAAR